MKTICNFFKPSIIFAIVAYAVTCVALYLVQHALFGGAVKTGWIYVMINPIFIGLHALYAEDDNKNDDETLALQKGIVRQREAKFFGTIGLLILAVILIGFVVVVISSSDPLQGRDSISRWVFAFDFQLIGLMLMLYIFAIIKITGRLLFALAHVSILLATVVYLLFARPVTVSNAQNALQHAGYQNVEHIRYVQDAFVLRVLMNDPAADSAAKGLGVYIFVGENNGEEFGIFVDIASGRHLMSYRLYDNPALSRSIEQRRRE